MHALLQAAERCQQLFDDYCRDYAEWRRKRRDFRIAEAEMMGGIVHKPVFDDDSDEQVREALNNMARALGLQLLAVACALSAPPGGVPLNIDVEEFSWYLRSAEAFNARELISEFMRRYCQERAHALGRAHAAQLLIKGLDLQRGAPLNIVSGLTLIKFDVFTRPHSEDPSVHVLSELHVGKLKELLKGLSVFLAWANLALDTTIDLPKRPVRSREVVELARSELSVRTLYEYFEFRFSGKLSAELQLFLDRFGGADWQYAA